MSTRAENLADRILQGAQELKSYVETLSDEQWQMQSDHEGRIVGVLVHHVASAYMVELDIINGMANGEGGISGVTWDMVDHMNAEHAQGNASVSIQETLALLNKNAGTVASAIREFSDDQLDKAGPVSLNWDAPLTTQFFIEEHPISHSFRHLRSIQSVIESGN
jgi:hypothetical protein